MELNKLPNEILDKILSYTNWVSSRVCYRWYELNRFKPNISDISSLKLLKWAKDYGIKDASIRCYIKTNNKKFLKYHIKVFSYIDYKYFYVYDNYHLLKHILSKYSVGNECYSFIPYKNLYHTIPVFNPDPLGSIFVNTYKNPKERNYILKICKYICKFNLPIQDLISKYWNDKFYDYLFKFNRIEIINKCRIDHPLPKKYKYIDGYSP